MNSINPKNLIWKLKILILISIPICLVGSYLTGIKAPSIITPEGQVIERGYYEHFTFLIISSIVLLILFFVVQFFVTDIKNKTIIFGARTISTSLVLFDAVLLFCTFSSLLNGFKRWNDFEFMFVFLASVPITVIFIIGLLILGFGMLSNFRKKHNPSLKQTGDNLRG